MFYFPGVGEVWYDGLKNGYLSRKKEKSSSFYSTLLATNSKWKLWTNSKIPASLFVKH